MENTNKNSLSEKLQDLIIHPEELAEQLANGRYGDHNAIVPAYPAISNENFHQTMENYRKHVALVNFQSTEENELIEEHNNLVKKFKNESKLNHWELEYSEIFKKKNSYLTTADYNKKVDSFCKEYGMLIEKKKFAIIKYADESVFQHQIDLNNKLLGSI